MNTNGKLQDLVGSDAWSNVQEPSTLFTLDDGREMSWLYVHYVTATREGDRLIIQWPRATIEILGPKCGDLHRDFCKGRATNIVADGVDITSVKLLTP
jgi:hypothetical protein